jgi:hypothetical protein
MKMCGGVEIYFYLHHSLSRHSIEASGQLHSPAVLPLGKRPWGCVGFRAGPDAVK